MQDIISILEGISFLMRPKHFLGRKNDVKRLCDILKVTQLFTHKMDKNENIPAWLHFFSFFPFLLSVHPFFHQSILSSFLSCFPPLSLLPSLPLTTPPFFLSFSVLFFSALFISFLFSLLSLHPRRLIMCQAAHQHCIWLYWTYCFHALPVY